MFYVFRQNNSGGVFTEPAIAVIIEADTPEEANHNALFAGVYFDPEYQIDCSCCGTRWTEFWEGSTTPDGWSVFSTLEEAEEYHGPHGGNKLAKMFADGDGVALTYVLKKAQEV